LHLHQDKAPPGALKETAMNIFKNLMFLQGHFIDPHMDDDFGQKYGHRDASSAHSSASAAAATIDAPTRTRAPAAKASPKKAIEITYLDVHYTSR
jgi:hypothetical protein